jgi:hypothetical protein
MSSPAGAFDLWVRALGITLRFLSQPRPGAPQKSLFERADGLGLICPVGSEAKLLLPA